jgi:hypothetical protein
MLLSKTEEATLLETRLKLEKLFRFIDGNDFKDEQSVKSELREYSRYFVDIFIKNDIRPLQRLTDIDPNFHDLLFDASNLDDYPDGYLEYGTSLEEEISRMKKMFYQFLRDYFPIDFLQQAIDRDDVQAVEEFVVDKARKFLADLPIGKENSFIRYVKLLIDASPGEDDRNFWLNRIDKEISSLLTDLSQICTDSQDEVHSDSDYQEELLKNLQLQLQKILSRRGGRE